ncbi:hypothetical protein ACLKA7_008251 [Drosophila subpalustris]
MSRFPSGEQYFWKRKLAYTEDDVLIKKLFFFVDTDKELEQQQFQKYFMKFGCVERLDLYPSESGRQTGHVTFANPCDAAKALVSMRQDVNGRINVRPSYSWHQPDAEQMPQRPENVDPNEPNEPAAIMKLNDYCLGHIFSLLSLRDRIHFARTCYRFRNIYEGMSPSLDKSITFELFEGMTAWELRDFFQLSGRNIKKIEGTVSDCHYKHVSSSLGKHCINLQSLIFRNNIVPNFYKLNVFKLVANLNSLQRLELSHCHIADEHLQAFMHLKQLKKLDLSFNSFLTGQYLPFLPNFVESLALNGCRDLKPTFLNEVLRGLPLLKELHLSDYTLSPGTQCKSLEILSFDYDNDRLAEYEHIARLPRLKKLIVKSSLRGENVISPKLISWLGEHKSKQLEHFQVDGVQYNVSDELLLQIGKLTALHTVILNGNCAITNRGLGRLCTLQNLREIKINHNIDITDEDVLGLILACPQLQVLNLEYCFKITDKLLSGITLTLQNNQYNRPLPIKLYMTGTKFSQSTLLNADVAAKNIIDVILT